MDHKLLRSRKKYLKALKRLIRKPGMARVGFLIVLAFTLFACSPKKALVKDGPVITFDEGIVDIGNLTQGESHTLYFNFTNTGNQDLLIELVTACKCTELDWPRSPVAPGQKAKLKVVFDSSTIDVGETIKVVDIIANTDPIVVEAKFKVNILSP